MDNTGGKPEKRSSTFDPKPILSELPALPGVYQMLGEGGNVLYVGKASSLKNRVSSYFRSSGLAPKTRAMVARIRDIQITVTNSETEALLLEQNLIKQLSPPYNILLRDDKSYPYIHINTAHPFPALTFRRARSKKKDGEYFGPFPSGSSVRESLNLLQKIFRVRQCDESFYRNRTRPCLQYQIKRCTAPCVGLISQERYREDIENAKLFLLGKNPELIKQLMQRMQEASTELAFEKAAVYRDQIKFLRHVQEQQSIEWSGGEVDVIAVAEKSGVACVHIIFVRGGRVIGSRNYYPKIGVEQTTAEITESFLAQYYLGESSQRERPAEIVVEVSKEFLVSFSEAVRESAGCNVVVKSDVRGVRRKWLDLALKNAGLGLNSRLSARENLLGRFSSLMDALALDTIPTRIECFDISHSSGESTVASCVVFSPDGPLKSDYRIYNITDITPGDDYAAMKQALMRRYKKRVSDEEAILPDILLIDGGKGQLSLARDVLNELNMTNLIVLGVAKGPGRKSGHETIIDGFTGEIYPFHQFPEGFLLIQQIRDEAHRSAVTGHKQRRDKKRKTSVLEEIPGLGPKRRRRLINYFGGLREIRVASVEEIAKVEGISQNLAQVIHEHLHQN